MRISLSPWRKDDTITVSKAGDVLTINGAQFDFTSLPDGATIPNSTIPCEWIAGDVDRIDGELHVTLWLPHGPTPEPWQAFPDPLNNVPDGPVDLPVDTVFAVEDLPVAGGIQRTTTTKRWHQADEVVTKFIPSTVGDALDVDA